jgi:peroxiredoxin
VVLIVVVVAITGMIIGGQHLARKTGSPTAVSSVRGQAAPDFELKDLDGKTLRLADLRGKAVLLNFWATWCPPCKEEIPWFVELQKQYGPQGLQIVGVDMDDNPTRDAIAKFAADMKIDYPVLLGNDHIADAYGGVEALPTTFYIGRDGKIVARVFGLAAHHEVEENIRAALKQGEAAVAESQAPASDKSQAQSAK